MKNPLVFLTVFLAGIVLLAMAMTLFALFCIWLGSDDRRFTRKKKGRRS